MRSGFAAYLAFLFHPFFRWWWAAVTGLASIFSVLVTPQSGVIIGPAAVALITFAILALAFLTLTMLAQRWKLYQKRYPDLRVAAVQKTKEHGGEYVALLCGDMDVPAGALVELRRLIGEAETLFAMIEVRNRTTQGNYLGVPIWTSPGSQKDFFGGKFTASQLVVIPYVQCESIERMKRDPTDRSGAK